MCSSASLWVINRCFSSYITGDYYRMISDGIITFLDQLECEIS
jgi:hypothetical protein